VWRLSTTTRLRARGCRARISIGNLADYESLPTLKTRGDGGGSVVITIGDDVELGSWLIFDVDLGRTSTLSIGAGSMFEHADRLQLWGGVLEIGEGVEIRDDVLLKASSNDARLRIGRQVKIGKGSAIHCHESVELEELVTLAERVTVVDTFHEVDGSDQWTMDQPIGVGPVRIERNALIHSGAVIVHGTTLGKNAVVAANALVGSGSYPAGVVLLGNPARAVRKLAKTDDG
jgi:acetyltransferase-like isoleucine patch superfamily enzyme